MHSIVSLVLGIVMLVLAGINFWIAGIEWPDKTYWKNLPAGRYTTIKDFANDRIVVKDVYGNEKIVFKRER